jgi:hypothetical protein
MIKMGLIIYVALEIRAFPVYVLSRKEREKE